MQLHYCNKNNRRRLAELVTLPTSDRLFWIDVLDRVDRAKRHRENWLLSRDWHQSAKHAPVADTRPNGQAELPFTN